MAITSELVGFVILILGFVTTAWVRVEAIVNRARSEAMTAAAVASARADATAAGLAEHRLHVAETYVSKVGLREQTERIMAAIEGVGGQVSHLNERIDRVIEGQPPSPRRSPKSP
ncbi:MAG: hypothetical protein DI527_02030 [Chelatococcus sp.]|nr:MAG: hypothetical protein DI527_02030 [Chelatococcus sp.]